MVSASETARDGWLSDMLVKKQGLRFSRRYIGMLGAGTVSGIMNFSGQIGSFALAIVFGKVVDLTHNFNAPLFVISGVLCARGLIWLVVDPVSKIEIAQDKQMLHSAT
jgi:hypothetical protein